MYSFAETLSARGYPEVELVFPPVEYCTDNAAMIAWTGLEMFAAGYRTPLSARAIKKWPLDTLLHPLSKNVNSMELNSVSIS
jgi:N6-L-threonylcarbamoyladenine synthase